MKGQDELKENEKPEIVHESENNIHPFTWNTSRTFNGKVCGAGKKFLMINANIPIYKDGRHGNKRYTVVSEPFITQLADEDVLKQILEKGIGDLKKQLEQKRSDDFRNRIMKP